MTMVNGRRLSNTGMRERFDKRNIGWDMSGGGA